MSELFLEKRFKQTNNLEKFIIRWTINIIGLLLAAYLVPGISFPRNQWWVLVLAALVFAVINLILKPIFVFLAIPAIILTLGIFMFFVNGALLYITSQIVPNFEIQSFASAVLGGLVISTINFLFHWILDDFKFKFGL